MTLSLAEVGVPVGSVHVCILLIEAGLLHEPVTVFGYATSLCKKGQLNPSAATASETAQSEPRMFLVSRVGCGMCSHGSDSVCLKAAWAGDSERLDHDVRVSTEGNDVASHALPLGTVLTPILTDEQLDLLETIWTPCVKGLGWPVWDYVARTLFRQDAPIVNAGPLWASLPRVRQTDFRAYSLVWNEDLSLTHPSPENRVGLTVAGLHALRERDSRAGNLARGAVLLISSVAKEVQAEEPSVDSAVTTDVPLARLLGRALAVAEAGSARRADLVDILRREYAPLDIRDDPTSPGTKASPRIYLAPYFQLTDADAYLGYISAEAAPRPHAAPGSALMVTQMLDYLSLLLRIDPRWDGAKPLTADVDIRPASTIALTVSRDTEFRDALSALAQLLEALHVPAVTRPDQKGPTKSLQKLQAWINEHVGDEAARKAATDAIDDLRAVINLRVEGQHPGTRPKEQARKARQRLGLDEVIFDWSSAWTQVLGRVVEALEAIRVAVRFD